MFKDFPKLNRQRTKLKGTQKLKSGQGQSGTTYHGARDWILKTRPFFSFLENVAEILQNDGEDDDDPSKEAADDKTLKVVNNTINDYFEKKGMTVVFVLDDPRNKGSLCARTRVHPCVVDIPRAIADEMKLEDHFHDLWGSLRSSDQHTFESFMVDNDLLDRMCSPLQYGQDKGPAKQKPKTGGDDWEPVHQKLFMFKGLKWPPAVDHLTQFRTRSAECIVFANAFWPEDAVNRWTYFDSNHDAKRLFRWPAKPKKDGTMTALKCPWRTYIPTLTSLTHMVARCLVKVDEDEPTLVLRRVHPIECMRVMGWDLEHFRNPPFGWYGVPGEHKEHLLDDSLLQDIAGNAWTAWTYTANQKQIHIYLYMHTHANKH